LSGEELDFIINYDIKYRMGSELDPTTQDASSDEGEDGEVGEAPEEKKVTLRQAQGTKEAKPAYSAGKSPSGKATAGEPDPFA